MSREGNAELMSRCIRGEQDAWEEMVERFGRLIWAVTQRYRLKSADAEDVRQLTWFQLVQNVHRIRDPERLGDWIATVARRESIKLATRRDRLVLIGDSEVFDGLSGRGESPEQIAMRAHRNAEVMKAIESLSEQCRDVLLMALADPPASYEEISRDLSMPVGSVGPIRTRCLRRLRKVLAASEAREEVEVTGCAGCPAAERDSHGVRMGLGAGSP